MFKSKKLSSRLKEYKEVVSLVETAFPKNERFPVWLLRLMALRKGIDFSVYYDDADFVGISYVVSKENMAFVLYLAVNPKIQSKGYGSAMLREIQKANPGKAISLNIEPVDAEAENYEQRIKRLRFYQKNGYHDTGYQIIDHADLYSVLSTAQMFDPEMYKQVVGRLSFGFIKTTLIKNEQGV